MMGHFVRRFLIEEMEAIPAVGAPPRADAIRTATASVFAVTVTPQSPPSSSDTASRAAPHRHDEEEDGAHRRAVLGGASVLDRHFAGHSRQGRSSATATDRHHCRAVVGAPDHQVPEKQSDIGNPRLRAASVPLPSSGSPPLPLLTTACQNPRLGAPTFDRP